ncbi:hypothetical protein BDZ89DRAFT_1062512, partial [Hymenopellis radicata]
MAALLRLFFFVSLALLASSTPISAGKRNCEMAPTEKDTCVTLTRRDHLGFMSPTQNLSRLSAFVS